MSKKRPFDLLVATSSRVSEGLAQSPSDAGSIRALLAEYPNNAIDIRPSPSSWKSAPANNMDDFYPRKFTSSLGPSEFSNPQFPSSIRGNPAGDDVSHARGSPHPARHNIPSSMTSSPLLGVSDSPSDLSRRRHPRYESSVKTVSNTGSSSGGNDSPARSSPPPDEKVADRDRPSGLRFERTASNAHSLPRPHKCLETKCHRRFTTIEAMKAHLRTHKGLRAYPCSQPGCDKSFLTAANLIAHVRTHTGERPFQCHFPDCDKSFGERGTLNKHLRIHTGEKPYCCRFCGRTFTQNGHVTRHEKTHEQQESQQRIMTASQRMQALRLPALTKMLEARYQE